tara:strand:- start:63 stop:659 length:597 start_codon:yes stop_codon:yes gene_type:complete
MGFKNYAVDVFGANSGSIKLPKQKYQYAVEFLSDLAENVMIGRQFNVSNVTLPSTTYNTITNNSYNKKVISILGKTYNPVTMTIRDDREGNLNRFLSAYDNHYFGQAPTRSSDMRTYNFTANENLQPVKNKDPINMIMILNFSGTVEDGADGGDVYTLFRPVITQVGRDTLNYADSGIVEHTVTFDYEYYDVKFNDKI